MRRNSAHPGQLLHFKPPRAADPRIFSQALRGGRDRKCLRCLLIVANIILSYFQTHPHRNQYFTHIIPESSTTPPLLHVLVAGQFNFCLFLVCQCQLHNNLLTVQCYVSSLRLLFYRVKCLLRSFILEQITSRCISLTRSSTCRPSKRRLSRRWGLSLPIVPMSPATTGTTVIRT